MSNNKTYFSESAVQKMEMLSQSDAVDFYNVINTLDTIDIKSNNRIKPVGDDFYVFRINKEYYLVFSQDQGDYIVTDVMHSKSKDSLLNIKFDPFENANKLKEREEETYSKFLELQEDSTKLIDLNKEIFLLEIETSPFQRLLLMIISISMIAMGVILIYIMKEGAIRIVMSIASISMGVIYGSSFFYKLKKLRKLREKASSMK